MSDRLLRLSISVKNRVEGADRERGDVPGWVMITLMTAGLVALIWALAKPALTSLFNDSVSDVRKQR